MALSPRQAAKAAGAKTYHGSPCKKCGRTERRTDNGVCVVCHKANGEAWAKANPAKRAAAAKRRYQAEDPEVRRARGQANYAANPEHYRKYASAWQKKARAANPQRFREYDRQRYASNPEPKRAYAKVYGPKWLSANPDKARAKYARWRSRGQTASPKWLEASGQAKRIERFYRLARHFGMQVDHDIPLSGCLHCKAMGLHVLANLQMLDADTNKRKAAKCMACFTAS